MTNKELQEELKKLPLDLEIVLDIATWRYSASKETYMRLSPHMAAYLEEVSGEKDRIRLIANE